MIPSSIRSITRTGAVASASFVLGILFLSDNLLLPQGNFLVLAIFLGAGLLLPLFLGINKSVARWVMVLCAGSAAVAMALLVNGLVLPVAAVILFVSLPCIVVFGFSEALVSGRDPASWRRDVVATILATCFVVIARAVKIAPFATWNALYVVVAMFAGNAVMGAISPRFIKEREADAENAEEAASHPLGMRGWGYFIAGIAMACVTGASAFVPGFLGDFAWIDPNPIAPGVPRGIIERPWAPWDTIGILAFGILVAVLVLVFLLRTPDRSLLVSTCMFSGFSIAWLMAWSTATIPFFIWSLIGVPCYFGTVTSFIVFIVRWFKPPRQDAWKSGECPVVGGLTRRAWLLSMPYLGSAAAGLMCRDAFNWSMPLVPVMVAIPVVAGAAILAVSWSIDAARRRVVHLPPMPFHAPDQASKRRVNSALVMFIVLGGLYAASYASYHAPYAGEIARLYAWGGNIGTWTPDVEAKVTHATVFALDLNATTGVVSCTTTPWIAANNTPYHARGIKVMPTIFLGYADLYFMLKNVGGVLDTFISTLGTTLVATGVDGVSIDFEMLVQPQGLPRVTAEDWIVTWERISTEACHAGGNDFLLGVYWQIGGQYTRHQVNRYFRAVDIHVENMYETHKQTGSQGSTTVIEVSISSVTEIYSMLDDKAVMAKVMPGLPVYHYIWIDGTKGALNESLIVPGGSWWWFHPHATLEQLMVANDATFRWDPFSGATWSRFTMTLQDNRTATVVAYLHDTGLLARTMHVMEGYGITGMMLWPAHQPVPPGFIDTFYQ